MNSNNRFFLIVFRIRIFGNRGDLKRTDLQEPIYQPTKNVLRPFRRGEENFGGDVLKDEPNLGNPVEF